MKFLLFILLLFIFYSGNAQIQTIADFSSCNFMIEEVKQINTDKSEISPFFVNGELFYSSQANQFYSNARERKNTAFYNIYKHCIDRKGIVKDGSYGNLVNGFGKEYHEGPAAYCKATGEMFVTKSNVLNPELKRRAISKENIRLRLAIMTNVNGKWEESESFSYNDSHYHFAHPAINASGDTLIFSSDMPGGFGNSDLYMSVKQNNKWTKPVNLGEKINTEKDEIFPTFLSGNVLAFSSDGREDGFGKLDIWYANFPLFSEVKNAGEGINSERDDFGLVMCENNTVGYFCSNRRGGTGSDDIYMVKKSRYKINLITKSALSKEILPGTNVVVSITDSSKVVSNNSTNENGTVNLFLEVGHKYIISAYKKGYKDTLMTIDFSSLQKSDYTKELYLTPKLFFKGIVLDKETGLPIDNATVKVKDRIVPLGEDGEFLLKVKNNSSYHFVISALNYIDLERTESMDGNIVGTVTKTFELIKIKKGVRFELDNIYYDYNKWNIREDATVELDKLIKILNKYPEIKIKLESHTDSRGAADYNRWLSEKRAKSCFDYLVGKGVKSSRIKYQGVGESQLVNRCRSGVKCSQEEHQKNRRTVIEITEGIKE